MKALFVMRITLGMVDFEEEEEEEKYDDEKDEKDEEDEAKLWQARVKLDKDWWWWFGCGRISRQVFRSFHPRCKVLHRSKLFTKTSQEEKRESL